MLFFYGKNANIIYLVFHFNPPIQKKISYTRSMPMFGSVIDRTFFYQFRSPHVFLKYQLV